MVILTPSCIQVSSASHPSTGHADYDIDLRIAAEVEGIDVIIGGHSHTFLYIGKFC